LTRVTNAAINNYLKGIPEMKISSDIRFISNNSRCHKMMGEDIHR
jgi:hypothetical protein